MNILDPYLRGVSEQFIDTHLEEKELQNMSAIVDIFALGIKNKVDANIGFFLGYAYSELLMQFLILYNRLPTKDETANFFNLLKRRYPEVLNSIKKKRSSTLLDHGEEVISATDVNIEPVQPIE
jgi:hypothetical protein